MVQMVSNDFQVPGRLHDEDVGPPRFHRDQVPRGDRRLGLGGRAEVAAHDAFGVIFFYVVSFVKRIFAMICKEYHVSQYFIPQSKIMISVYIFLLR